MKLYREAYEEAVDILSKAEIENVSTDAWYLMEYVTGLTRVGYYMRAESVMAEETYERYQKLLIRRAEHTPLQYITGEQEFMGLSFQVNETVLIPRQDTEILVEQVLKKCNDKNVLDLCTGSGCIIVSLAKLGSLKMATASDLSRKAISVASKNAKRHGVEVTFLQGDMFAEVTGTFDIIVSNPPYIPTREIEDLMPEVRVHEPLLALDGAVDGLKYYKILARQAPLFLNKGGEIYLEIGYNQAEAVCALLLENGFKEPNISKDYAGLDRVVSAVMQG